MNFDLKTKITLQEGAEPMNDISMKLMIVGKNNIHFGTTRKRYRKIIGVTRRMTCTDVICRSRKEAYMIECKDLSLAGIGTIGMMWPASDSMTMGIRNQSSNSTNNKHKAGTQTFHIIMQSSLTKRSWEKRILASQVVASILQN